jgi:hypothetical protein
MVLDFSDISDTPASLHKVGMEYRVMRKIMPKPQFERLNSVHRLGWTKFYDPSIMWDAVKINAPNC